MIKIKMLRNEWASDENDMGVTVGPNRYDVGTEYDVGPLLARNLCSIGAAQVVQGDQPFLDMGESKAPARETKDLGTAPQNKKRGKK